MVGTAVLTIVASKAARNKDRNRAMMIIVSLNFERDFVALSLTPFSWIPGALSSASLDVSLGSLESKGKAIPGVAGDMDATWSCS